MLKLSATYDIHADVVPWILKSGLAPAEGKDDSDRAVEAKAQTINVESNGTVLYTWKGNGGNTCIGAYDPHTQKNKLLYTFEEELLVISCSVNKERTLLAVSVFQSRRREVIDQPFRTAPRCLTLLIEIQPINNTKVLKAVDCHIRVQFLYPVSEVTFPESHLLLISEDRYIEQTHISVVTEEGYRVMIKNPHPLPTDRVTEDFSWAQWDMKEQRLYFVVTKETKSVLNCLQFYPDRNFELVLEVPLEFSLNNTELRLVSFGYDPCQMHETASKSVNLCVFSSELDCAARNLEPRRKTGSMFLCYSHLPSAGDELSYTIVFVLQGISKTFTVSVEGTEIPLTEKIIFINLDYYIAVYLPGHFLHLINTRQPKLICHHLFLSDAKMPLLNTTDCIQSLPYASLLDYHSGELFQVSIDQFYLLNFLCSSTLDCHRMAALHCALVYFKDQTEMETQIILWICDNMSKCGTFDIIQEFILASLYRRMYPESINLDKLLPYSSVTHWEGDIPGVTCVTEITEQPVFRVQHLKGFWDELHSNLESFRYLDAEPCCRYNNNSLRRQWKQLIAEMDAEEKRPSNCLRITLENAKKVLSTVDTWVSDQRLVPLFQEEDYQQRVLMGLMVENLKDHLVRHLQRMGRKKIDMLVVNYVAKMLELIRNIMETVWRKYGLGSWAFCFKERGSSSEFTVFHIMSQILEAANGMCAPLPPGFQTLHIVLGVRCLPLHTLLHYIDHGMLRLTEPFVIRLLKDLDNTETNEQLKFSIITRLPEAISQKICHLWDHPISSSFIARNYVRALLQKLGNRQMYPGSTSSMRDRSLFHSEFLPLNYLTKTLTEVENLGIVNSALNPFEEQENVDAKFVEEIALKQTSILLGLENY